MNAVGSLWEQTQLWQTNYMADVPRPSYFSRFRGLLARSSRKERCRKREALRMIRRPWSTVPAALVRSMICQTYLRLPRNKVGPYIQELSQLVWDRFVVVDTSAAAGDGVLAAFSHMSPGQLLGGGQSLDPQDGKLYYVGY